MNILVIYATYSSSTQTAVAYLGELLTNQSHAVTIKQAQAVTAADFADPQLIVFASPSWLIDGKDGQPHEDMLSLMQTFSTISFAGKKIAVLGLGDTSYAHFCGAVDHIEQFVKDHQGTLVVPSLRIDGYYMNQDANNQTLTQWSQSLPLSL